MMAAAAILLFFAYCIGLSLAARRDLALLDRYLTNALLVIGYWALLLLAGSQIVPRLGMVGVLFMIPIAAAGIILALGYVSHLFRFLVDSGAKVISSVDRLPPHPRFDQADKAMAEKRYDDAIRRYLESAEGVPGDPEPLRRAGEACLVAGRIEEGVGHLRKALQLTTTDEDRASLGFRIAEVLERQLSRLDEARDLLVRLATELKGTRFGAYARERHALIQAAPGRR